MTDAVTDIRSDPGPIVLINVFTVAPARTDELVAAIAEATEVVIRRLPGFIGNKLHVSLDRSHVVNYAQWRSKADFDAMNTDPKALKYIAKAAELVERFEPHLYTVAYVEDRPAARGRPKVET